MLFKQAQEALGQAPLSKIKDNLDRMFGKSEWVKWEHETLSLELGLAMDDLLRDKLHVLQIIERKPELFFDDVAFMLHATDVMNNHVADFEHPPAPTTLELGFAIHELKKLYSKLGQTITYPIGFVAATAWFLRQEGYSKPVGPFEFVPEAMLEKGQTEADTAAKKEALEKYIAHMEAL